MVLLSTGVAGGGGEATRATAVYITVHGTGTYTGNTGIHENLGVVLCKFWYRILLLTFLSVSVGVHFSCCSSFPLAPPPHSLKKLTAFTTALE